VKKTCRLCSQKLLRRVDRHKGAHLRCLEDEALLAKVNGAKKPRTLQDMLSPEAITPILAAMQEKGKLSDLLGKYFRQEKP
jgi:hypothetical protein